MNALAKRVDRQARTWRRELALREARDELALWEAQGWDCSIGSQMRWAVLNRVCSRLTKYGVLAIVIDHAHLDVL